MYLGDNVSVMDLNDDSRIVYIENDLIILSTVGGE